MRARARNSAGGAKLSTSPSSSRRCSSSSAVCTVLALSAIAVSRGIVRRCGLMRFGLHVLAAVDGVDLAGDEPGVGVGEELDDPGDLVGFTEAPGGNLGDDLLKSRLGYGGDHLRGDVARRNGVDGDALACGLLGEAHGQAEQACLGRGVVGLAD